MKNTFKKIASISLLTLMILTSCSKDDDSTSVSYQEEDFIGGYLSTTGFSQQTTTEINVGNYEFGNEFTPIVNGKITNLKVKLPDSRTDLRITIWDKTTGNPIKTEIVNVSAANTSYTFDIPDVNLVKDKEYAITMNSNDWYKKNRTDNNTVIYPITVGNIKINSYKWIGGATQSYPTNSAINYYAGDLSFSFQQIE